MALFSQVRSFFYYEKLAWVEGCIMNNEGKAWWLIWLGREETDVNGWHRGFCGVLSFCNDTKLNFIMATG
jgi:hypothetical protein